MRKRRVAVTLVATAAAVAAATGSALAFGVFGSPQSIPVHVAYQVALGDLNGDGKTDLAATNDDISTDGFVYALGRGDGSFKPSHFVAAAGGAPEGIAIGKFNSDRRADVALGDFDNSDVEFFFGKKGGGFSTGPISYAGPGAYFLKTGDFNEDGRTDLVTCNYSSAGPKAITVILQKRTGGFAPRDFTGLSSCYGVDVGRINDDKHLDVVEQSYDGPFAVFLGKGNGAFKPHRDHLTLTSNDGYDDVSIGDFTGDGRNDVAVASYDDQRVLVYPGNASGSLKAPKRTDLNTYPQGIEAADYNRDGKLDLALGGYEPGGLTVLLGKGDGKFKSTPHIAPETNTPFSATAGRLNRDKAPDIVLGNSLAADVYINGSP